MTLVIKSGLELGGIPSFTQVGDEIDWTDGVNEILSYDGKDVVPMCPEGPRILRIGENIGYAYDKDDATYQYFIRLDPRALFADDRLIGSTITLTDGTNTDEAVITDSWKAYSGGTHDGYPVVRIPAALTYDFVAASTTYKIHRKYSLSTAGTGGHLSDGAYTVLVSYIDKGRAEPKESAIPEFSPDNTYGDLTFYTITLSAGTATQIITIAELFRPPPGSVSTHWRVYVSAADGTTEFELSDTAIGTWAETATIVIAGPLTTIESNQERQLKHHRIAPTRFVASAQNRFWTGGTRIQSGPGTITVSATYPKHVVGTGTAFIKAMEGMRLQVGRTAAVIEIRAVLDATHIELTESSLLTGADLGFAVYNYPRTVWYGGISFLTGKPDTAGTDLYGNALEMPVRRGDMVVGASRLPGSDDLLVHSENSGARIQSQWNDVPSAFEWNEAGAAEVSGIVSGDILTAWIHGTNGLYAATGDQLIHLSERCPRQFSEELCSLDRNKFSSAIYFIITGGRRYVGFTVAPKDSTITSNLYTIDLDTFDVVRYTGPAFSALGVLRDSDGIERPVAGDISGRLWWLFSGNQMGARSERRRGVVTSATATTFTDTNNTFETDGSGEVGVPIALIAGTGAGQERWVFSNTAHTVTPHEAWETIPDETTVYQLGANVMEVKEAPAHYGAGVGALKKMYDLNFTVLASDPVYSTGRVQLTNGSSVVTLVGAGAAFPSGILGEPLVVVGDVDHVGWVKTRDSATQVTLTAAWTGQDATADYYLGPKLLIVELYKDLDESEVWSTIYVPMVENVVHAAIGAQAHFLTLKYTNYDEAPVSIYNVEPEVTAD